MYTKNIRLVFFLLAAVTSTALLTSCQKSKHDDLSLTIHWSEAPTDTTTTLLISYTDTLQAISCDTLVIEKPKGKVKLRFPIFQEFSTPIQIRPEDGHFVLILEAASNRDLSLRLPLAHPSLAQIKGYEKAKVATRFVKQEKALLKAYDEAVSANEFAQSDSLYRLIEAAAARFIVKYNAEPGIKDFADRYFMTPGSVARWAQIVGDSILPDSLVRQNILLDALRHKQPNKRLWIPYRPLDDTINSIRKQYETPDSCLLVVILSRVAPSQALMDSLQAIRCADTISKRDLYTIALYPQTEDFIPSTPNGTSSSDSIPKSIILRPLATEWYYFMERNSITQVPQYILLGRSNQIRFSSIESKPILDTVRAALPYAPITPGSPGKP